MRGEKSCLVQICGIGDVAELCVTILAAGFVYYVSVDRIYLPLNLHPELRRVLK